MTDHIIDITYYPNVHQYTARAVYQYDKGWQLKISGLTTNKIIQVQYGIEGMAQTLNIDPEYQENCYIAKIPDVLLTQIKGIVAYVYVADMSLGQTVCYIRIPITPREKPADYTYTQEETAGYAQLLAQLTQATKEVEALDKELETLIDATATVTESANAATQAANDASQAANEAVAEFETIKQDVNSQISELEERLTELEENPPSALPEDWTPTIENIEGLSDALGNIVEVSSEEPQDKNTELWINPDSEELQIPQIDDVNVSAYDTYSSQKIEEKVTGLQKDIKTLANTISLLHTDAGVPDTSAKASSHELYATDTPMHVTLYGATTQSGSGDPSPDNVRPISGVDAAWVHAGGKNLLNFEKAVSILQSDNGSASNPNNVSYADGVYSVVSAYTTNVWMAGYPLFFPIGTSLVISADVYIEPSESDPNNKLILAGIEGTTRGNKNLSAQGVWEHVAIPITIAKNTSGRCNIQGGLRGVNIKVKNMMIEVGSTATPYEPYNATTIDMTAALNGEALYEDCTIENDVPSGYDKCVVFDGSDDEAWTQSSTSPLNFFIRPGYNIPIKPSYPATNRYACYGFNGVAAVDRNDVFGVYENFTLDYTDILYLRITGVSTLEDLRANLAANPLKVYYRSNEYTSDKDLRVCMIKRRVESFDLSNYASFDVYNNQTALRNGCCYFVEFRSDFANIKNYKNMKCAQLAPYPTVASLLGTDAIGCYAKGKALYIGIKADRLIGYASFNADDSTTWAAAFNAWLVENPVMVYNTIDTPEVLMTDPVELRKPTGLVPVTVTGSGETEVAYAHDTKHYIDSKISDLVTLTLANQ